MRLAGAGLCLSLHAIGAAAHGSMQWPPIWMDDGGACGWGAGCFNTGVMWFTNDTIIPGKPTMPAKSALRTYGKSGAGIYPGAGGHKFDKNPWWAPGTAPVHSPCGINGGNPTGCPAGDPNSRGKMCPGGGTGWGPDALHQPWPKAATTDWQRGSIVEAGWGIRANHGGGYQYRMCKRDASKPADGLTEECFKKTPLAFAGGMQWVQFGNDTSRRVSFRANRTSTGTVPAGSTWTKNPIPPCGGPGGGGSMPTGAECPFGTQFPPPATNLDTGRPLHGFCESTNTGYQHADCPFAVVDRLVVPADMAEGDWVLSFRWDCEQTPQVWTQCSNVRVTA